MDMFKNFSNYFSRLFNKSSSTSTEDPVMFLDEFTLLVKNKRVIDYSKLATHYQIPVKLGVYMDTFNYLKGTDSKEIAANNINNVLKHVLPVYEQLVADKFALSVKAEQLSNKKFQKFERLSRNFEVSDLILPDGNTQVKFCINLLIRPGTEPFLIIGKEPKGKIRKTSDKKEKPLLKVKQDTPEEWDFIDFDKK